MKETEEMHESYEPSPLEIWRQCSDIQATWSPHEERRRRRAADEHWCPPGCERELRFGTSTRIEIQ